MSALLTFLDLRIRETEAQIRELKAHGDTVAAGILQDLLLELRRQREKSTCA